MKSFACAMVAASAAAFNFSHVPGSAIQMISGIVLKERSELAKCRADQGEGETKCFDGLKECINNDKCLEHHFERYQQCNEPCEKAVKGCLGDKKCQKVIVDCIDSPDGCLAENHMSFHWSRVARSTQQKIVAVVKKEAKLFAECYKKHGRSTCEAGIEKCVQSEKCIEERFEKEHPKCFHDSACEN